MNAMEKKKIFTVSPDSKASFSSKSLKKNQYCLELQILPTKVSNLFIGKMMKPAKNLMRRESAYIYPFRNEVQARPNGNFAVETHIDGFVRLCDPKGSGTTPMTGERDKTYPWYVSITHNISEMSPQQIGADMARGLIRLFKDGRNNMKTK
jgi:hypothetical protein